MMRSKTALLASTALALLPSQAAFAQAPAPTPASIGKTIVGGVTVPCIINVTTNACDPAKAAGIVGQALSATTDTTNAANIATGTLPAARLPAFAGDISCPAGTASCTVNKIAGQTPAAIATSGNIADTTGNLPAARLPGLFTGVGVLPASKCPIIKVSLGQSNKTGYDSGGASFPKTVEPGIYVTNHLHTSGSVTTALAPTDLVQAAYGVEPLNLGWVTQDANGHVTASGSVSDPTHAFANSTIWFSNYLIENGLAPDIGDANHTRIVDVLDVYPGVGIEYWIGTGISLGTSTTVDTTAPYWQELLAGLSVVQTKFPGCPISTVDVDGWESNALGNALYYNTTDLMDKGFAALIAALKGLTVNGQAMWNSDPTAIRATTLTFTEPLKSASNYIGVNRLPSIVKYRGGQRGPAVDVISSSGLKGSPENFGPHFSAADQMVVGQRLLDSYRRPRINGPLGDGNAYTTNGSADAFPHQVTGPLASGTITASIDADGTTLHVTGIVTAQPGVTIMPGQTVNLTDATGAATVSAGTTILSQINGVPGGTGDYQLSQPQTPVASENMAAVQGITAAINGTTLTVTGVNFGTSIGTSTAGSRAVTLWNGAGATGTITTGTVVVSQVSGVAGQAGVYQLNNGSTVTSQAMILGLWLGVADLQTGASITARGGPISFPVASNMADRAWPVTIAALAPTPMDFSEASGASGFNDTLQAAGQSFSVPAGYIAKMEVINGFWHFWLKDYGLAVMYPQTLVTGQAYTFAKTQTNYYYPLANANTITWEPNAGTVQPLTTRSGTSFPTVVSLSSARFTGGGSILGPDNADQGQTYSVQPNCTIYEVTDNANKTHILVDTCRSVVRDLNKDTPILQHLYGSGAAPTITASSGTATPSTGINDNHGTVVASAAATITVKFAAAWTNAPDCVVEASNGAKPTWTTTPGAVGTANLAVTTPVAETVTYQCEGH